MKAIALTAGHRAEPHKNQPSGQIDKKMMTKAIKLFLIFLLLGAGLFRCKQNYVSPYVSPHTGYLVVEGYISGNGPTQFTLSRTVPLPGSEGIPLETGAQVQVEGSDSSVYPLMTK